MAVSSSPHSPGVVALCGSRSLPSSVVPLVSSIVGSLVSSGRPLAVGCAAGADAAVVSDSCRRWCRWQSPSVRCGRFVRGRVRGSCVCVRCRPGGAVCWCWRVVVVWRWCIGTAPCSAGGALACLRGFSWRNGGFRFWSATTCPVRFGPVALLWLGLLLSVAAAITQIRDR